jgi:carbonic anhydrase
METLTAEEALERLKLGNDRFRSDRIEGAGRDGSRREALVDDQQPFAVILGCADSRVCPEIAFDAGLGELFVTLVAGNVANRSSIASIEFAVANLGPKLVVVMGHEGCGAVSAALEGGDAGPNLDHLLEHIQPAVAATGRGGVNAVSRSNAALQTERMVRESDIIRNAVENGGVKIIPAFYELRTGRVCFV